MRWLLLLGITLSLATISQQVKHFMALSLFLLFFKLDTFLFSLIQYDYRNHNFHFITINLY